MWPEDRYFDGLVAMTYVFVSHWFRYVLLYMVSLCGVSWSQSPNPCASPCQALELHHRACSFLWCSLTEAQESYLPPRPHWVYVFPSKSPEWRNGWKKRVGKVPIHLPHWTLLWPHHGGTSLGFVSAFLWLWKRFSSRGSLWKGNWASIHSKSLCKCEEVIRSSVLGKLHFLSLAKHQGCSHSILTKGESTLRCSSSVWCIQLLS